MPSDGFRVVKRYTQGLLSRNRIPKLHIRTPVACFFHALRIWVLAEKGPLTRLSGVTRTVMLHGRVPVLVVEELH